MIHSLATDDNATPADLTSLGHLVIRVFEDRLEILPLLDRSQAERSYTRLQALVRDWAEDPRLLANICEVQPPSDRQKSWAITWDKLRQSWN
jgi:hypothetical protein